jgi:hypothetical protein
MRWTLAARTTNALQADGEVMWFWHLDADAKLATMLLLSEPATVTRKPDHREEHEGAR